VKYPKKGLIVLDPLFNVIQEVIVDNKTTYSVAERYPTGIVKIPYTHIEAIKSDFINY
jgi:sporulation protein YlmC with PRC-barrel domain